MGEDDGCLGDLQNVSHGLMRNMREVDEHAQAVHLLDQGGAKVSHAQVRLAGSDSGSSCCPCIVAVVGESHVASSSVEGLAQGRNGAANLVATLHVYPD